MKNGKFSSRRLWTRRTISRRSGINKVYSCESEKASAMHSVTPSGVFHWLVRVSEPIGPRRIHFLFSLAARETIPLVERGKKNRRTACQSTSTNDGRVIHAFHYIGTREARREREGEKLLKRRERKRNRERETATTETERKKDCACPMFFFIISSNLFEV